MTAGARLPFSPGEKVSDEVRRMRVGAKRRVRVRDLCPHQWQTTAAETLIRPRLRRAPFSLGEKGAAYDFLKVADDRA